MSCRIDMTAVFNTRAKIALIGLFSFRPSGFRVTGRAAARLVRLSPPGAHAALKALHASGMLKREIIGRQHVYSLNADESFVREAVVPFFQKAFKQNSINQGRSLNKKANRLYKS